jgi:hypothetical protein
MKRQTEMVKYRLQWGPEWSSTLCQTNCVHQLLMMGVSNTKKRHSENKMDWSKPSVHGHSPQRCLAFLRTSSNIFAKPRWMIVPVNDERTRKIRVRLKCTGPECPGVVLYRVTISFLSLPSILLRSISPHWMSQVSVDKKSSCRLRSRHWEACVITRLELVSFVSKNSRVSHCKWTSQSCP